MEEEWIQRVQKRDTEFIWAILDEGGLGPPGNHRPHAGTREGCFEMSNLLCIESDAFADDVAERDKG